MTPEKTYQHDNEWDKRKFVSCSLEQFQRAMAGVLSPEFLSWLKGFPDIATSPVWFEEYKIDFPATLPLGHKIGSDSDPNRWEIELNVDHTRPYNYHTGTRGRQYSSRLTLKTSIGMFAWAADATRPNEARVLTLKEMIFYVPPQAKATIPAWYLRFSKTRDNPNAFEATAENGSDRPNLTLTAEQKDFINQHLQIIPTPEGNIGLTCHEPLNVEFSYPVPTRIRFIGSFPQVE